MTQLTIEINELDYAALQAEAKKRGDAIETIAQKYLSIARIFAQEKDTRQNGQWPEGYFDFFGSWQGETLKRPEQGKIEQRLDFD